MCLGWSTTQRRFPSSIGCLSTLPHIHFPIDNKIRPPVTPPNSPLRKSLIIKPLSTTENSCFAHWSRIVIGLRTIFSVNLSDTLYFGQFHLFFFSSHILTNNVIGPAPRHWNKAGSQQSQ